MEIKIENKLENILVLPIFKEKKKINFFNNKLNSKIKKEIFEKIKLFNFQGEENEICYFNIDKTKILLIGIKKNYSLENLRRAYSIVFKTLKEKKEFKYSIEIPKEKEEEIIAIVEGLDLTNYKFDKYISKKEKKKKTIISIINIDKKFKKNIIETQIINKEIKFARNLINENSDIITPEKIEILVKEFAKENKLKIKTLNEKQIQKEKLNLLNAVSKGSSLPPRLIIVEYTPNKNDKNILALIGKGITFDTGGINLKPTGYLEDMKSDMGGAASVFGIFKSIVNLKIKKNLILVIATAENAISSTAYKPGDVLISYNNTSVEIGNTDAEGRLILADAISYVQKNYKPTHLIDIATLTGACLVALGPSLIGMLGNNDEMKENIFLSGEKTFERVWELPIYNEHREMIKSKIADIKNIGGKYGGVITAAAFLEKFIENKTPWVHLDIAGAGRSEKEEYYISEFGTGKSIRLIVDYIKSN